ncbi:SDR family NAD(P)-dependent oxidoreductase [Streptomyces halobius]|uniref:SDR family NAD(P)-dependent oxidoreductase n=2 Tax=Streptomyces halobius TaxID=2879846 RepID=A0ABY4MLC9_9ACTN|nr:SDR family NAD(P)-dependent oxidoreductase [Streptomyces halobius]
MDDDPRSWQALTRVPFAAEPQTAIREGTLKVARITPSQEQRALEPNPFGSGAVVVTGAGGQLGRVIARHLVVTHGVRDLLLLSRSGAASASMTGLWEELAELGAQVAVAACDVADRDEVHSALSGYDGDITGVVHAAGVLDDGFVESLTAERVSAVLRPKVDAVLNLHDVATELGLNLTNFVVFSSAASLLGSPGQGSYAAANAFLNEFARVRSATGVPTLALDWGLWEASGDDAGMTSGLSAGDLARLRRSGFVPLAVEDGLGLFDRALAGGAPVAVPIGLDRPALAKSPEVPALLRELVPVSARAGVRGGQGDKGFVQRLRGLDAVERRERVQELVIGTATGVLGRSVDAAIDADTSFSGLGFDSLAALELRNRLGGAVGQTLPASLIFDYPDARSLTDFLLELLVAEEPSAPVQATPAETAAADEPIAIVGVGCRFPGGVVSPEGLWELVASGTDAVSGFPSDRGWDVSELFDDDPEAVGRSYARAGGFVHGAGLFDADFFGINRREALAMDPQQRLLLECSWEAVERAGMDPLGLRGSRTGVYTGLMYHDYGTRIPEYPADLEGFVGTGVAGSVASGRVAYTLGLEGPALTVDTACSSSLVAVHMAVNALRSGECSLALAGGATIMSTPGAFIEFSRQRGLSPDGRCKAFSEEADGVGWGEGVGVLMLERLSDAVAAGRRVLAVVRGCAVNQDGASSTLTAPRGPAQRAVVERALAAAGVEPGDVDVVEGHGTGTRLGDPMEVSALQAVYGRRDGAGQGPLWLGSVKSNIGHAQAAAGVAGIIKMVGAFAHDVLPPTLHAGQPSSAVEWDGGGVELLREARPWEPDPQRPRRAGVSSFGISGTNAHLILEEPPRPVELLAEGDADEGDPLVWRLSAKSSVALRAQAARMADFLADTSDAEGLSGLRGIGAALERRTSFGHRATIVATPGEDATEVRSGLVRALETLAFDEGLALEGPASARTLDAGTGLVTGGARAGSGAVWQFSGQGTLRPEGLGRLWEVPDLAPHLDAAVAVMDEFADFPVREVLAGEAGDLSRTGYAQVALFVVQVALVNWLRERDQRPDAVMGHSVGEFAAMWAAGMLELADAAALVAERARLMEALPDGGAMIAIHATREEVEARLAGAPRSSVAAVNGPESTVVSGPEDEVTAVAEFFRDRGRKTSRLRVSHAFHSPLMEPAAAEFRTFAEQFSFHEPSVPFYSTQTGTQVTAVDAEYVATHITNPVLYHQALTAVAEQAGTFVEVGPDTTLTALARTAHPQAAALPLLTSAPDTAPAHTLTLVLHTLTHHETPPPTLEAGTTPHIDLPTYPFQHTHHWLTGGPFAGSSLSAAEHPLLDGMTELPVSGAVLFTGRVSAGSHPWLAEHRVHGRVLVPGTALVELAAWVGAELGAPVVDELVVKAPVVLGDDDALVLQALVERGDESGARGITVHSRPVSAAAAHPAEWSEHMSAVLSPADADASEPDSWTAGPGVPVSLDGLYEQLADFGLDYGPLFRGLRSVEQDGRTVIGRVEMDEAYENAAGFALHPALFDAALHAIAATAERNADDDVQLPFSWRGVRLHRPANGGAVRVLIRQLSPRSYRLRLTTPDGEAVIDVAELTVAEVSPQQIAAAGAHRAGQPLLVPVWRPAALTAPAETDHWSSVGFVDDLGFGSADSLEAAVEAGAGVVVYELGSSTVGDGASWPSAGVVHQAVGAALDVVCRWLAAASEDQRLVVVSRWAAGVEGDLVVDAASAAALGLLRSAQAEHPGRIALVDMDDDPRSWQALTRVPFAAEPQTAIREGTLRVARITPSQEQRALEPNPFGSGAVVVTGAGGQLGRVIARHLVVTHEVRDLLLLSRSGAASASVTGLRDELSELGAQVAVAACDVANGDEVRSVLAGHNGDITGIVHSAGVLDDGFVESLTAERVSAVLRPKVDAVLNLHDVATELGLGLTRFVVFSSAAAVLGGPGQGSYAAANAFLNEFARVRSAAGMPTLALDWGLWEASGDDGMASGLSAADLARLRRSGFVPLAEEEGVALFDRALAGGDPVAMPLGLDRPALGRSAEVPTVLRELAPVSVRSGHRIGQGEDKGFAQRLRGLDAAERRERVRELVIGTATGVLGRSADAAIDADTSFSGLGFDSLTALELRNRLGGAVGQTLPASLIFDYPDARSLTDYLLELLVGTEAGADTETARPAATAGTGADEPIAIVGVGCRFPGGVVSPEGLWGLVASQTDAVSGFPVDRGWDVSELFDEDPDAAGKSYAREGGFVHGAGLFDPDFFGINPREAMAMDPQQRLLLECSWEAAERAGMDPLALRGSRTGVYTGLMYHDYGTELTECPTDVEGLVGTGVAGSVASGRVAYTLGLEGPALTVDTACSSSLVAVHMAVNALRSGECSLALAGGATIMSTPRAFIEFSRQRGLSPDGRCKAFSEEADGVGWGEGVGVLMLERLSDAVAAGRRVLAVVRGCAVNQDGASSTLTAPRGPAQRAVVERALAAAGVEPGDVDVVEGHGTGTRLGDPMEVSALQAVYGHRRGEEQEPLWLGSVKSNVGHAQAAAGVAGIIKMIGAFAHRMLPPTLHAAQPSSAVEWDGGGVELLREARPWEPDPQRPRRAGVSSFGISGTNAHVILEEPPLPAEPVAEGATDADAASPVVWRLSAKSSGALRALAARMGEHVAASSDADSAAGLRRIAAALNGRSRFAHRATIITTPAENASEVKAGVVRALETLAFDEGLALEGPASARTLDAGTGLVTGGARAGSGAVWQFSGQGTLRPEGLGRLWEVPDLAPHLDAAVAVMDEFADFPVREVLAGEAGDLSRTGYAQVALFVVQVALVNWLRERDQRPDAVMGHSVGEFAAMWAAGMLELADAAALVAERARLMEALPDGGAMIAVNASPHEVEERLAGMSRSSVAAVNGPESTVVSGPEDEVTAVAEFFRDRGRKTSRLRVSHAFHSPLMEPAAAEFRTFAEQFSFREPSVPFYSTQTGAQATTVDAEYVATHITNPVLYHQALTAVAEQTETFVEVGPDTTLTALARTAHPQAAALPLLTSAPDTTPAHTLTLALHTLTHGQTPEPTPTGSTSTNTTPPYTELPTYPFQRTHHWLTPTPHKEKGTESQRDDDRFWKLVESGDTEALAGELALTDGESVAALKALLPALARRLEQAGGHGQDSGRLLSRTWHPYVGSARVRPLARRRWVLAGPVDGAAPVLTGRIAATLGDLLVAGPVARTADELDAAAREHPDAGLLLLADAASGPLPAPGAFAGRAVVLTSGAVRTSERDALPAPGALLDWAQASAADDVSAVIDVPQDADERALGRLAEALGATTVEPWLAVRAQGTFVQRLEEWTPRPAVSAPGVRPLVAVVPDEAAADRFGGPGPDVEVLVPAARDGEMDSSYSSLLARLESVLARRGGDADFVVVALHEGVTGREDLVQAVAGLVVDSPSTELLVFTQHDDAPLGSVRADQLRALTTQLRALGTNASTIGFQDQAGLPPLRALVNELHRRGGVDATATPLDWNTAIKAVPARLHAQLQSVPAAHAAWETAHGTGTHAPDSSDEQLRTRLAESSQDEAAALIVEVICREAADVIGYGGSRSLGADQLFADLGLGSLMAVELRNRVAARTGLEIPVSLFYDQPTPMDVAARLAETAAAGHGTAPLTAPAPYTDTGEATDETTTTADTTTETTDQDTDEEEY